MNDAPVIRPRDVWHDVWKGAPVDTVSTLEADFAYLGLHVFSY